MHVTTFNQHMTTDGGIGFSIRSNKLGRTLCAHFRVKPDDALFLLLELTAHMFSLLLLYHQFD